MSPELDTIGPVDFGGRLTTAMTAHPKEDPITGDLFFFGYGFFAPYLTYHRLSKDGVLVESREIPVKGPTMMHDFAITENYVVWLDLPVVFDLDLAFQDTGMPYRWDDAYGARIGYMLKSGGPVTWVDVDPCYVFHVGNAREDAAGNIVIDAVRYSPGTFTGMWGHISGAPDPAHEVIGSRLHRWTISGTTAKEEQLDDRTVEFPTINDGHTGLPGRYLYAAGGDEIVKYDLTSGATKSHGRPPARARPSSSRGAPPRTTAGWSPRLHRPGLRPPRPGRGRPRPRGLGPPRRPRRVPRAASTATWPSAGEDPRGCGLPRRPATFQRLRRRLPSCMACTRATGIVWPCSISSAGERLGLGHQRRPQVLVGERGLDREVGRGDRLQVVPGHRGGDRHARPDPG